MGRFRFHPHHDDDGDHDRGGSLDDQEIDETLPRAPMDWEFVPSNSQEASALTLFHDAPDGEEFGPTDAEPRFPSSSRARPSAIRGRTWPAQTPFIVLVPSDSSMASSFPSMELARGGATPKRSSSWRSTAAWYATCALVAAFAAGLQLHGPPGPPVTPSGPSSATAGWSEFLGHHTRQVWDSTAALVVHTPLHLLYWWIESARAEVATSEWWSGNRGSSRSCSLRVPHNLQELLREGSPPLTPLPIVGQPWAVQVASEAVQAWHHGSRNNEDRGPLVLLLAGYPSSGKRTLARSLARAVSNCTSTAEKAGPPIPVLRADRYRSRVNHRDNEYYDKKDEPLTHLKLQLEHDILRHVTPFHRDASANDDDESVSFVVLDNVEDMAPGLLKWMLTELKSAEHPATVVDPSADLAAPSTVSLRQSCRRVIFFLISASVGTKTIATWIRQDQPMANPSPVDGRTSVPRLPPGIALDLAHEIDGRLGQSVHSHLSAVVPFVPLTPDALVHLFVHRLNEYAALHPDLWKDVAVQESDVHRLLERRVEFLSWRHRPPPPQGEGDEAPRPLLTFATAGAAAVGPVLHELVAQIGRCAAALPQQTSRADKTAFVNVHPDDGTGRLIWCHERALAATCEGECALMLT